MMIFSLQKDQKTSNLKLLDGSGYYVGGQDHAEKIVQRFSTRFMLIQIGG
uniref:Uncharacterized protein n=1 Tax=Candidatus Kentrum eta TaxID=2126337 RepID=A0A450V0D3_9GAMM|nr:MAG: hypothetical protein BECKH772A_GA0070896_101353 [Candidatus Kentron sp. H]VFJ98386.1 MAG: hypothetical protein BECKH772B_GA0070898_101333 [Candidatus Kentron sp. H]VFK03523.1 MAG: hypothetical protein BECKH772C_GA0070978_101333 [Candidatus Kentron sp. H]